jgi:hypothetical protein
MSGSSAAVLPFALKDRRMSKRGQSFGVSIAAALALACVSGPLFAQDTLVETEVRALEDRADRITADLNFINEEISGIVNNKAQFDSDLQLRSDEVQSLTARFPEIQVETSFKAEMFVAALQEERIRKLHEAAQAYQILADFHGAQACSSYKIALAKRDEILVLPSFLVLPISERIELRRLIDAAIAEAVAQSDGDPCELTTRHHTRSNPSGVGQVAPDYSDAAASVKGL